MFAIEVRIGQSHEIECADQSPKWKFSINDVWHLCLTWAKFIQFPNFLCSNNKGQNSQKEKKNVQEKGWQQRLSGAYVNSHFGFMKGNKKDGGKRKRAMALFESEGSFVHREQHYPFLLLTTFPLLISMPFCILGRHCSVAREYAVRLKTRKAIVAVERRAKKFPFSFSRCKLVHSYTLFAKCFRSIQKRAGFDKQVFWRTKICGSWNWKIWRIEIDLFYFSRKFHNLNVLTVRK